MLFHARSLARALVCSACASAIPAPAAPPIAPGALTLQFVALDGATRTLGDGQALIDAGRVTAQGVGRKAVVVVRQRVGVLLQGANASARVLVSLATDVPGCIVRVNGRPISPIPQVVDPAQRIGATVAYQIEMVIPADAPPGGFLSNLQWQAEAN